MRRSSVFLNLSSGFILVYVSAIVFRAITGNVLFAGGVLDWRYLLVAVLISAGFLIGGTGNPKASIIAVTLFSVLFILTYGIMAAGPPNVEGDVLVIRLLVYPAFAIALALAMRISFREQD